MVMNFSILQCNCFQMSDPSPTKITTKLKKQQLHPVFPPSSLSSNIDNIKDTEIGHVDLEEFLERVRESLVSYKMEPIINSGIHLVVAFPMSTQNLEFVLSLAKRYDSTTRLVKDVEGKENLINLDEDFFDTIFKCLPIDQYVNIDIKSVVTYYDNNSDKCRRNINDNWLKTSRPTISRWPKTLPCSDFIEEVNDLITLFSIVKCLLA